MGSVQTTYARDHAAGMAGLLSDLRDAVVESYSAEGTAGIGFGLAVVAGTDPDRQVKLPTGEGLVFRGITLHEYAQEQQADGTVEYAEGDTVNVGRRCRAWVRTAGSVTRDQKAFFIISGADAGKFSNADDASTDEVPTGVFRSSVSGAGLAELEINLPGGEAVAS